MKIACVYNNMNLSGLMSAAIVKYWFNTTQNNDLLLSNPL